MPAIPVRTTAFAVRRPPRPPRRRRPSVRARRTERARIRASARRRLAECGVSLEIRRGGAHVIVRKPRCPVIDLWPDAGAWSARGRGKTCRGLRKLLDFLHRNR